MNIAHIKERIADPDGVHASDFDCESALDYLMTDSAKLIIQGDH